MAVYRIHRIRPDGVRQHGERLDAFDHREAIELVRLRLDPLPCELWFGTEKVAFIPAEGEAPVIFDGPALPLNASPLVDEPRQVNLHSEGDD